MSAIGEFTGYFARALEFAEKSYQTAEFQFHLGELVGLIKAWNILSLGDSLKERIFPDLIFQHGRRSNYEIEELLKKFKIKQYVEWD